MVPAEIGVQRRVCGRIPCHSTYPSLEDVSYTWWVLLQTNQVPLYWERGGLDLPKIYPTPQLVPRIGPLVPPVNLPDTFLSSPFPHKRASCFCFWFSVSFSWCFLPIR